MVSVLHYEFSNYDVYIFREWVRKETMHNDIDSHEAEIIVIEEKKRDA